MLSESARFWKKREVSFQRRYFIGGSDARTIMGDDENENALLRLWREKRGEAESEDLSGNLVVQLGLATEDLNRHWYQANTDNCSPTFRSGSGTRCCAGWWLPATAVSKGPARFSRPSSCCPGHSRKKRRPRNTCRSCSTICGWLRPEVLCFR